VSRRAPAVLALLIPVVAAVTVSGPASADDDDGLDHIAGEFLVEVDPGVDVSTLNTSAGGLEPPEPVGPGARVYRFVLRPDTDPERSAEELRKLSGVKDAQPNLEAAVVEFVGGKRYAWADVGPADPSLPADAFDVAQSALGNAGLPATLPSVAGSPVIAVLDTGIDVDHPALRDHIAPGGLDLVDNDNDPREVADGIDNNGDGTVDEAYGHGTYVAGIVRLIAPDARLLPIRILDSDGDGSAWRIAKGLLAARAAGATIVNLSLGAGNLGRLVEDLVKDVTEDDVIVVAAAGNDGIEMFRYPAAYSEVVSVAAYDGRTTRRADFTTRGSWVQLAAPGVDVVSTYPGGRYARWGGTSAATPVVTAAAALIRQIAPRMPADDVAGILYSYAQQGTPFDFTGHGALDAEAALNEARVKARDFGG
jgi:subtilisin family serine protease